jgi:anti-sigma factor RsiW
MTGRMLVERVAEWRGIRNLFQRLTLVALLAAGIPPRGFPEASHPWRLLQSIARGWFGTVGAVQSQAAFQFGYLAPQGHVLGRHGLYLEPLGLHLRHLRVEAGR